MFVHLLVTEYNTLQFEVVSPSTSLSSCIETSIHLNLKILNSVKLCWLVEYWVVNVLTSTWYTRQTGKLHNPLQFIHNSALHAAENFKLLRRILFQNQNTTGITNMEQTYEIKFNVSAHYQNWHHMLKTLINSPTLN